MRIPWPINLGRLRRWRIAKTILISVVAFLGVIALYLVIVCHPGPFFRYRLTRGEFAIHSDEPIPESSAARILDDVEKRLARSPLYRRGSAGRFQIYICNRKWRFLLFANIRHNAGGLTHAPISNNIFLRQAHLQTNRLVGPSGNEVPAERTLSYYITHEIVHTLIADELGPVGFWRLPTWKNEGYADYVGKGGNFDYARCVGGLRSGAPELDPRKSGLYLRHHLLVAYLLNRKGFRVDDLLRSEFDPARLETEILDAERGS